MSGSSKEKGSTTLEWASVKLWLEAHGRLPQSVPKNGFHELTRCEAKFLAAFTKCLDESRVDSNGKSLANSGGFSLGIRGRSKHCNIRHSFNSIDKCWEEKIA